MSAPNTAGDILSAVIPVATFAGGYFLSYWDRNRDARKRLANLRSILIKELDSNAGSLNKLWPVSNELKDAVPFAEIIVHYCADLSTSVYDSYLDRLDSLTAEELSKVFRAYESIKRAIEAGHDFENAKAEKAESRKNLLISGMFTADTALQDMLTALQSIKGGSEIYDRLLKERGSEIQRANEMQTAINQALADNQPPEPDPARAQQPG